MGRIGVVRFVVRCLVIWIAYQFLPVIMGGKLIIKIMGEKMTEQNYCTKIKRNICVTLILFYICVSYAAAEATAGCDPNQMLVEYFRAETVEIEDNCLADIETLDEWKAKRKVYHKQLFEALGLEPFPKKTDLKPVITGRVEHDEFTVENLHFQPMPGLYVAANLYIPKNITEPAPTILYVCGHAIGIKDGVRYGNKVPYQYHAAWFARNGYVCFVIDTIHRGEIEGIHHGTHQYDMWWWNSRGYSSAGLEAYNSIRALDYLETRKEVDKDRFGVTGRSGGGAYSWWLAALDERVKVAVPVAGITDMRNYVIDGCVDGHCDCMFIVNTYQWDYPLVAALAAPRPLLISNSDKDSIFPLDGVVRVHKKVSHIYELYGAEKNLGLHITEGPHSSTQELRVHTFKWFNRFLKNQKTAIDKLAVPFFEWEQLKVFDTLPGDSINADIQDTFTAKASSPSVPKSKDEWAEKRDSWRKALLEKSFRGWPCDEKAGPLDVKKVFSVERDGIRLSAFDFTSQRYVQLRLYLAQGDWFGKPKPKQVVLNVLDQQEWTEWLAAMRVSFAKQFSDQELPKSDEEGFEQIREMLRESKQAMAYVAPRGVGPTYWGTGRRRGVDIRRRFMMVGQTLDGMRVWDVRRSIQALRTIKSIRRLPVRLSARNHTAGIALYASLFEPDIAGLDLHKLPNSHHDGPALLNVLRYLDMPQAVAMAAERSRVIILNADNARWNYPISVADRLGWEKNRLEVRPGDLGNNPLELYNTIQARLRP